MTDNSVITQAAPPGTEEFSSVADLPDKILLSLHGVSFELDRQRLLYIPDNILYSLSSAVVSTQYGGNAGLGPGLDGGEVEVMDVDFDPVCFQYVLSTLDAARYGVAPVPISQFTLNDEHGTPLGAAANGAAGMGGGEDDGDGEGGAGVDKVYNWIPVPEHEVPLILQSRPAVIVLREDLQYFVIRAPDADRTRSIAVKEAVGDMITQNTSDQLVFYGLNRSNDLNSPEYQLKQMLILSGLDPEEKWHYRRRAAGKAQLLSLELTRVVLPPPGDLPEAVHALHKMLLFWRKPARKCWWGRGPMVVRTTDAEGREFEEEVRVHVRRVWTLELSIIGITEEPQ